MRQFGEPRPDARQRAHEAAGAQQPAARKAAGSQIAVELLLVHLVHVQKPVCGPLGEGGVLDVFAEHAGALLLAAAEKVSAIVMMGLRQALLVLLGI